MEKKFSRFLSSALYLAGAVPRGFPALFLLILIGLYSCSDTPSTVEEYIAQGDRQLSAGETLEAIATYRIALHKDTLNPVILARLSKVYTARGHQGAALQYARRAANITYENGLAALKNGDDSGAVNAFEQTLDILPSHPLALNRLGDISLARKDEESALEYYSRSVQANPDFADSFIKLGQLHMARGEYPQARESFEGAITANINAVQAYLGLGEVHLRTREWTSAIDAFEKALLIRPTSSAARAGIEQAKLNL